MNLRRTITLYKLLKNIKKFYSSYYVFIDMFENFDKVCILYYEKNYTESYRNILYFVFIKNILLKMEKIYGNENKMLKGVNNDMLLKGLKDESKQKIFENTERIFILEEMNKKLEIDIHNLYTEQNYEIIQEIIKYYLIDNLLEESYITEILKEPKIVNIIYFLCISINENVCPNRKENCQVIKRNFIIKLLNKNLQIKNEDTDPFGIVNSFEKKEGEEKKKENTLNKYTYSGTINFLYKINDTFSNNINIISKNYSIILFYINNRDSRNLNNKIYEMQQQSCLKVERSKVYFEQAISGTLVVLSDSNLNRISSNFHSSNTNIEELYAEFKDKYTKKRQKCNKK